MKGSHTSLISMPLPLLTVSLWCMHKASLIFHRFVLVVKFAVYDRVYDVCRKTVSFGCLLDLI
ncbi:hypothetical protein M514_21028 [Trichuris suis]|uniref:Secreted protein n=1 Tax=Trichuris suis TaxID=68888 RepID=A0A085NBN8_9BILA|nr:hypothetical protein M514_21028 [Trichuris suis]